MRRLQSNATWLALLLMLALAGCNAVVHVSGFLGDASITGQVSLIRVTFVSDGATHVNVTIVTFLNATSSFSVSPARATDVSFCGHIADRFTMDAVQTVNFNPGSVCGTVVSIVIR